MDISEFILKKETVLSYLSEAKQWRQDDKNYVESIEGLSNRLSREDVYIAILGRQGAGKSTIGNVFLEGKYVFPMHVEETTNILTMVTGIPEDEKEYAEIFFNDKAPEKGDLSSIYLEHFVSDKAGFNLNNQKGVTKVKCYAHVKWLEESGAWLVDTPGVNSLREYNQDITMDFLPKITVGIFLCTVNPPIQQDEKQFLDAIWKQRPLMYFVQNRYGEPFSDVTQSETWNLNVFKELSEGDSKEGLESERKIYTVEVGNALNAYEETDPSEDLEDSGATELLEDLSKTINDQLETIRLKSVIGSLSNITETKINGLNTSLRNLESEIVLKKDKVEEDKNKKKIIFDQCKKNVTVFFNAFLQEINQFYGNSLKELEQKATMTREDLLIQCQDQNITPEYFQKQFKATVKRYFDPPMDTFNLNNIIEVYIESVKDELKDLSDNLGTITHQTIIESGTEKDYIPDYSASTNVESEDFLKFLSYALEAVGLIEAGAIVWEVGSAVFGAGSIVTALTTGSLVFGTTIPIAGWIIAAGGFLIAIGLKGYVKKKQREAIESAAIKSINEVYLKIQLQIRDSADMIPDKFGKVHQTILNKADELFNGSVLSVEALQAPLDEQKENAEKIKNQIEEGKELLKKVKGLY